jgi:hypothetical protein
MTEPTSTTHPLLASYLEELSRLLQGVDAAERAEVTEGVREHIDAILEGTGHTDGDVRAALAEVGPAQAVADEAYAGRPWGRPPAPRVPATSRAWLPAVTAGFEAVAVLVVLAAAGTAGSVTTSSSSSVSVAGGRTSPVTESHFEGSIGSGIVAFFAACPFWLVVVVLVGISSLWLGREKLLLTAVMPACAVAFAALPELGYGIWGVDGVYAGAWTATAFSVLGCGGVVAVLVRRAHQRARSLRPA